VSRIVLDASIVLTWCFPDEEAHKAQEIAERIAAGAKVSVPPFWRHEILNALLVAERRKRITPELTQAFLNDLARLPVAVDDRDASIVLFNTRVLSRHYGLTAYDAAYLELAAGQACALATVDQDLRRAAIAQGVEVL
jgi:predicted nucleic acid-binding protein